MIIKFTVGNFLSFKEKMTFSLAANKDTEHEEALFSNGGEKYIKTAAIYGLNASGKSNFIKAIRFFRDFVNSGFVLNAGNSTKIIPVNPFLLNEQTEKQPSFFEAIILINGEKFVYGFEVSQKEVHKEWLYRTPGKKKFFSREKQNFDNYTIQLQKNDQIYIFSDGYADQFGRPNGKKYMIGNFRRLLTKTAELPINEQKEFLSKTIVDWQG